MKINIDFLASCTPYISMAHEIDIFSKISKTIQEYQSHTKFFKEGIIDSNYNKCGSLHGIFFQAAISISAFALASFIKPDILENLSGNRIEERLHICSGLTWIGNTFGISCFATFLIHLIARGKLYKL
ncbi:MAG: hypothetical protein L0207_07085 [Chlamydiae bacterium]|nr:hypothetical protein [Chlamydiota bacterium]